LHAQYFFDRIVEQAEAKTIIYL